MKDREPNEGLRDLTPAERAEVALATVALQRALYRFVAEPRSEPSTEALGG